MRRSSHQQIIDWNARRGEHPRLGMELISQIVALRDEAHAIAGVAPLHLQFVPIRLVTILEVFLREVIAELVDGDELIFERAEKLVKGARIDFAFAAHVNRRELTIGDFVAHTVSLNSVEGIMNVMDTLIGGFADKLQKAHPRWSEEEGEWPLPPIVANYDAMMAALSRLFEVRHVLTHELPSGMVFDTEDIPDLIDSAQSFVEATEWSVTEVLRGSIPRTQLAMNMTAGDDLLRAEEELETTIKEVATLRNIKSTAFDELQAAWLDFAKKHADLVASQVEGGSMYPMVWASEKAALIRDRTIQLRKVIDQWMD